MNELDWPAERREEHRAHPRAVVDAVAALLFVTSIVFRGSLVMTPCNGRM